MPRLLLFFFQNALKACIFTSDGIFFVIFIGKRDSSVCCLHWIGSLAWNSTITPVSSFLWVRVGCLLSDTVFSTVFFLGFFFLFFCWALTFKCRYYCIFYHQNTCEFSINISMSSVCVCLNPDIPHVCIHLAPEIKHFNEWNHSRPLQSPQCPQRFFKECENTYCKLLYNYILDVKF